MCALRKLLNRTYSHMSEHYLTWSIVTYSIMNPCRKAIERKEYLVWKQRIDIEMKLKWLTWFLFLFYWLLFSLIIYSFIKYVGRIALLFQLNLYNTFLNTYLMNRATHTRIYEQIELALFYSIFDLSVILFCLLILYFHYLPAFRHFIYINYYPSNYFKW